MSISKNIPRLLKYRNALEKMQEMGIETVYSYDLARETAVSPEQVRKDFSLFGIRGKRKGGYNVSQLILSIKEIFRKDELQHVIVVGAGNIGNAVLQYQGFQKNMIEIVAAFDIDPDRYKTKAAITVYPLEKLPAIVEELGVKTAILAVPELVAQEVTNLLIESGIKGILSFVPSVLMVPPHITISYICIGQELESLIYHSLHSGDDSR